MCRGREPGGAGGGLSPPTFCKGGLSPPKIWLSMGQMKNVKYFVMPDVFRMNVYSELHEHRAPPPPPPPPPPTFDKLSLSLMCIQISLESV